MPSAAERPALAVVAVTQVDLLARSRGLSLSTFRLGCCTTTTTTTTTTTGGGGGGNILWESEAAGLVVASKRTTVDCFAAFDVRRHLLVQFFGAFARLGVILDHEFSRLAMPGLHGKAVLVHLDVIKVREVTFAAVAMQTEEVVVETISLLRILVEARSVFHLWANRFSRLVFPPSDLCHYE